MARRHLTLAKFDLEEAVRLRSDGWSFGRMAKQFGVSKQAVQQTLAYHGIVIPRTRVRRAPREHLPVSAEQRPAWVAKNAARLAAYQATLTPEQRSALARHAIATRWKKAREAAAA